MAVLQTVSRYRWVILGLSLLCQWSAALAGQVLAPLAPIFQPELGSTKAQVGIFSSATFAGAWSVLLIAGSLTDRVGIRRMASTGQVITGAILLGMATVGSVVQAAVVMFAAGIGRGTVFPGSTKAVMEWFPPSARATAMGIKQTGAPLAGIVSAATLPALGLAIGWRAAIAVVGFVIIAGGIVTALLYRDGSGARPKTTASPTMFSGMGSVIRNRRLWTLSSVALLFVMAQQSLITYLALYFKEVVLVPVVPDEGARIVAAGGFLAIAQLGGVTGRIGWGMVSDRLFGGRRFLVLAIVGSLAACLTLTVGPFASAFPAWLLTGLVFVTGATVIGWNGVYHALITETVGHRYAATGVGLSMTVVESGTMLGPPLFGLAIDLTGSYQIAWFLLSGLSCAGTLVALSAMRNGAK